MDEPTFQKIKKITHKYSLPLSVIGGVVFIGIVSGSLWYAFSGAGRHTQYTGAQTVSTSTSNELENTTSTIARILDGVFVASGTEALPTFAIAIDGHVDARPTAGLSKANLVFNMPVEGGITRYLAVYDASSTVDMIGPVRSARPYCVELADALGSVYGHVGGSPDALKDIKNAKNFRDLNEYFNSKYYWRSNKKLAPHNTYTRIDILNEAFIENQWKPGNITSWKYKEDDTLDGTASTTVRGAQDGPVLAYGGAYRVKWEYDREENRYIRKLGGSHQIDADGSAILAKNIAVISMPAKVLDDQGRLSLQTIGRGKAVLYRDGRVFDGVWRRLAGRSFVFETIEGSDLLFNRGTTWIEIIGDASVFAFYE